MTHDKHLRHREFQEDEPVWIKNELHKGYRQGVITKRTADLSYEVRTDKGSIKKHADQLKSNKTQIHSNENESPESTYSEVEADEVETQRNEQTPEDIIRDVEETPDVSEPRKSLRLKAKP
ncbi:hypothetical protein RF11_00582 [Thelohanellus kitauei]|nr:hypothetical protein RF11_00582 [Thelohanellus kitauei]